MSENVFWSFSDWSSTVTVHVGDTVTWENRGSTFHNAVADDGSFRSGNLRSGQSYSHTFSQVGEYSYSCTLHLAEDMFGRVVVLPTAASSPTPSPTPAPASPTPRPRDGWHVFVPYSAR